MALSGVRSRHFFSINDDNDEPVASVDVTARHGVRWVSNLYVQPSHRREGLAKHLMEAVLSAYSDCELVLTISSYADAPMDDAALAAFYATFGFCPTDVPGILRRVPQQGRQA